MTNQNRYITVKIFKKCLIMWAPYMRIYMYIFIHIQIDKNAKNKTQSKDEQVALSKYISKTLTCLEKMCLKSKAMRKFKCEQTW